MVEKYEEILRIDEIQAKKVVALYHSLMLCGVVKLKQDKIRPTNQCTRIAMLRFYNGYVPTKKWVIVATLAHPQSRDFKR